MAHKLRNSPLDFGGDRDPYWDYNKSVSRFKLRSKMGNLNQIYQFLTQDVNSGS